MHFVALVQYQTILKMNYEGWPYLGIWSKPGAPFLCLEPWFSTADRINRANVFNKNPDLITLQPKEEFEAKYRVEFF